MNDLFGTPEEVRNSSGEVRSETSGLLNPPKGKGKSGRTGLSLAGIPAKSGGLPFPSSGGKGTRTSGLRQKADSLINEIELAERDRALLVGRYLHLQGLFRAADEQLRSLVSRRPKLAKTIIMKAYNARLNAGHDWHPIRTEFQHVESWLRAIRKELTEINQEIDK